MFENVNYNFYSNEIGRSVIPDEATFDGLVLENKLFVKELIKDGILFEKETNGFDSAVCLMCEVDYNALLIKNSTDDEGSFNSESLGVYSYSKNNKGQDVFVEKNFESVKERKFKWIKLFCDYVPGVS